MLQSSASIETSQTSSSGLSLAQVDARINALAVTPSAAASTYLKIADADDQYAPRTRSVQLRCIASGLEGTSASAVASTFAASFQSIDASRVTAFISGSDLRLVIACDESNVTSVKNTMTLLDAATLQAKLPTGVTVSTSDALTVGAALLTKNSVPIMLYT